MSRCQECNKEIEFKKLGGVNYAVEGGKVFFVPDETSEEIFVNCKGYAMKGVRTQDGQYGYKLHGC